MNTLCSIFTGTWNTGRILLDTYNSIKIQTFQNWQWVIVDDGSTDPETLEILEQIGKDNKVLIILNDHDGRIGYVKDLATRNSSGNILLELDHDDLITENCLEEVAKTFENNPKLSALSSNFAEFGYPSYKQYTYNAPYWQYRDTEYRGRIYKEALYHDIYNPEEWQKWGLQPYIYRLELSPNHIRAYRKSHFFAVGGIDPELPIADDLDILQKLYIYGKIGHIDKLLYLYRVWDDGRNTFKKRNKLIQEYMIKVLNKPGRKESLDKAIKEKCKFTKKILVDLGCGFTRIPGYIRIDKNPETQPDYICDLSKDRIPLEDNSVDVVRAYDIIEHLPNKVLTLSEIYRICKPNALIDIQVPDCAIGEGAFGDPTHTSYWTEFSFNQMYMNGEHTPKSYKFEVISLHRTPLNKINVSWIKVKLRVLK